MEGITTHVKRVTIANAATSSITFTNVSGTGIKSNFISLSCSTAGAYLLVPSGIFTGSAIALGNAASGTYGVGVANAGGVYELTLGHNRYATGVSITNLSGASRDVLVTYGIKTGLPDMPRGFSPGF
jgi:hypothetical protein